MDNKLIPCFQRGVLNKMYIIGAGGIMGAFARYTLSGFFQNGSNHLGFPLGSMAANLLGCLLIGFIVAMVESSYSLSAQLRTVILVVFLGAFTTFSSLGQETLNLMRSGEFFLALINAAFNVVGGLAMVWTGRIMVGWLWK